MNLLTINDTIGIFAVLRGGGAVGRAIGERIAIELDSAPDVAGRYTVPQIAAALAAIDMSPTEGEYIALEAVAAAKGGR